MRADRWKWLFGLAAVWLGACDKPCDTTAQCGEDGMCVAAICQPLTCERTLFALDPSNGECVPLSGCFLTDEQRGWHTCNIDPCQGLDENSCVSDIRCQPAYANPNVQPSKGPSIGGGGRPPTASVSCGGTPIGDPRRSGDSAIAAPGVNNGDSPKHPPMSGCSVIDNSARVYSGCRSTPRIAPQKSCERLTAADCKARRDCSISPSTDEIGRNSAPTLPLPGPVLDASGAPSFDQGVTGQCFTRFTPPATECSSADATGCLLSPACQPVGTRCFCPVGGQCDCDGGQFLGCEQNDRLRRCASSADCSADERCDNDEACITPRTFESAVSSDATPGSSSCIGACVPKGCAGLGEKMCNAHAECDGGSYGTVCRPKPYCSGGGGRVLDGLVPPSNNCGCDSAYTGCAALAPVEDLRSERSLLIRDPEIIDDRAFAIDTVLGKLAPAGQLDAFTAGFLKQVGAAKSLGNGAVAVQRNGFGGFLKELNPDGAGVAQRLAGLVHITALVNRLDLAKPGTCGEARLTYALTKAYTDGNQRMTIIVELRVPDDGMGCRTVAQRWAELSLVDDSAERRTRLIALYNELLKPDTLGQIRTNEFLNRTGVEPWELREFHLNGTGMLDVVPVAQTVDTRFVGSTGLQTWIKDNAAALHAGNAIIPNQYLAAASREDGGRLNLASADPLIQTAEKDLNAMSCAGCHLTETKSPFVHIGERLGKRLSTGSGYLPQGRAVIDTFLQKELVTRAKNLRSVLRGTPRSLLASSQAGLARVH